MLPIFLGLAISNTILLLLTMGVGTQYSGGQAVFGAHFSAALFTGIFTLFVHCIVFTYFVGTGKWIKETISNGVLKEEEWWPKIKAFKRKVFPINLYAMIAVIATAVLGATAYAKDSHLSSWIHQMVAYFTLVLNLYAFYVEGKNIKENSELLAKAVDIKQKHIDEQEPGL